MPTRSGEEEREGTGYVLRGIAHSSSFEIIVFARGRDSRPRI